VQGVSERGGVRVGGGHPQVQAPTGAHQPGGDVEKRQPQTMLAGGDFLSDRVLLADPATTALRAGNPLPSVPTLWRFLAGADLGRVAKAAAVNRVMLRRAWAAGAAPGRGPAHH
jgi:hypothetical protein